MEIKKLSAEEAGPPPTHSRRGGGKWAILRTLEIGEAVEVPEGYVRDQASLRMAAYNEGRLAGKKFTVSDYKIWRVK